MLDTQSCATVIVNASFINLNFGTRCAHGASHGLHAAFAKQGPQCTACGSPMRLSAIEPSAVGQDLRTFTCPHCNRVQRHIIESAVTEAWLAPKK